MANKKTRIGNVPNLRFPEFEGEWVEKKLVDMIEFKAGYAFPSNKMLTKKSTYQLIKMSNVYQNDLRLDRNPSFWPAINSKEQEYLLRKGDTVLTLTGTVGKKDFGYSTQIDLDNKYLLNQRLVMLREINNKSVNDFIKQIVSNERFLYEFFGVAKGGTGNQANVGIEDIKNILFSFPSVKEQQKIASLLSLIDKQIQTQNQIIEKLETLIKGICQNLQNKAKWKKHQLKNILKERKEKNTKNYPIHSVSVSKGIINQIDYLGRSFAAKDTSSYNVVHYGDIVYTKSPTGDFPYGIIKQSFVEEKVGVSPLYGVFEPKSIYLGTILHYYFSIPINTNNYLHSLIQKGAKNTINITNQHFLDNEIYLPADENEIRNIAVLLNVITQKINLEEGFQTILTKQKEYLLRRLFI